MALSKDASASSFLPQISQHIAPGTPSLVEVRVGWQMALSKDASASSFSAQISQRIAPFIPSFVVVRLDGERFVV